jgi:hypothetical protein
MAQMYTTGPAFIWIGATPPAINLTAAGLALGSAGANALAISLIASAQRSAQFIGTCETPPKIDVSIGKKDVFNDLGGSEEPFDRLYLGRTARTTCIINRENMPPILTVQSANVFAPIPGIDVFGDIGALQIQEGYCYSVFVVFPYSAKVAYPGQPFGYRFPFSTLEDEVMDNIGTDVRRFPFSWKHLRGWTPNVGTANVNNPVQQIAGVAAPGNSFMLYDWNMALLPQNGLSIN